MILLLMLLCLIAAPAFAQAPTKVSVDYDTTRLTWDWVQGEGGECREFIMHCGPAAGSYTIHKPVPCTQKSVLVKDVLVAHGTYFCAVGAVNAFGASALSNEVPFDVGEAPASPSDLQVVSP